MARRLKTQARTAARRRKAWPALDFARPAPVVGFDPAAGPDQTRRALVMVSPACRGGLRVYPLGVL